MFRELSVTGTTGHCTDHGGKVRIHQFSDYRDGHLEVPTRAKFGFYSTCLDAHIDKPMLVIVDSAQKLDWDRPADDWLRAATGLSTAF